MKNLLISALVAWIMHATNFIVEATAFEYMFILVGMAAACFMILEWIDSEVKQMKRQHRHSRPIQRCTSINFEGTRI